MTSSIDRDETSLHTFREEMRLLLREEMRNQGAVSHELAANVLTRLVAWAKIFGFIVGLPAALIIGLLTILGIREYSDVQKRIEGASKEVKKLEAATKALDRDAKSLESQLRIARGRLARINELESELSRLRSDVRSVQKFLNIEPSKFLTHDRVDLLELEASLFQQFLFDLGFEPAEKPVTIICDSAEDTRCHSDNAYYDLAKRRIIVGEKAAADVEAFLYNYAKFAVLEEWPSLIDTPSQALAAAISGVADYFTCSYVGDPLLGEVLASKSRRGLWLRNLKDDQTFDEHLEPIFDEYLDPTSTGGIWASILWSVRETVGRKQGDSLAYSWLASTVQKVDAQKSRQALAKLLEENAQRVGEETHAVVRKELEERRIAGGAPDE